MRYTELPIILFCHARGLIERAPILVADGLRGILLDYSAWLERSSGGD